MPSKEKTIDNFVVSPQNHNAYRTATQILGGDSWLSKQVFIFGSPSVGKTHLLHALAQETERSGKQYCLLSGARFGMVFGSACKTGKVGPLEREITSAYALFIDEIDKISPLAQATQKELAKMLDYFQDNGRPVIISSNFSLDDSHFPKVLDNLYSRLSGSNQVIIGPPDTDTLVRILDLSMRKSGEGLGVSLEGNVAASLVDLVNQQNGRASKKDPRVLFGLAASVFSYAAIEGETRITPNLVVEALRSTRGYEPQRTDAQGIIDQVCAATGVTPEQIYSRSRKFSGVRGVCAYVLRLKGGMTQKEVAESLYLKNHTSVGAACERVEEKIASGDAQTKDLLTRLGILN